MNKTALIILNIVLFSMVLIWADNYGLFNIVYILEYLYLLVRLINIDIGLKKIAVFLIYSLLLSGEIIFNTIITFNDSNSNLFNKLFLIINILFFYLLIVINKIVFYKNSIFSDMPTVEKLGYIGYNRLLAYKNLISDSVNRGEGIAKTIAAVNWNEILKEINRNSSFRYINKGTLTDEYFKKAYSELEDENIYIVITKSNSTASNLIGLFTSKEYNHVSISFDDELDTLISYNGGDKIYCPGLNQEMLEKLIKREKSSIMVYRLHADLKQKQKMIE